VRSIFGAVDATLAGVGSGAGVTGSGTASPVASRSVHATEATGVGVAAAGGVNDADGASVTPSRRGALTGGFMLDEG
jgi:hypothetical protein